MRFIAQYKRLAAINDGSQRKLISQEDADSPCSDSKLAEILSQEGIPVARRTVAKYREGMQIAPSNERKRAAARAS